MSAGFSHRHYNPDWVDDDSLVAGFVARTDEFGFLRDELARAPRQGSVQHYLLVGLRGAGKTTLLKRLAVAIRRDPDLADHLIALSFPEELYQVKHLADFWWAACEALADELDRRGDSSRADHLQDAVDRRARTAEPLDDAGFKVLQQTCAELGRRPVLLVDNLDFIFQRIDKRGRKLKDPHAPAYWALREALSTAVAPIVVGGSVRLSEPFTGYDKAFYDFFMPRRLGRLSLDEVHRVIERLADAQGVPEVKQRLHARPARVEALYELTGGNPRALGLIFELLRQGADSRAVEDFERLMDITTPYYKARFEDLSEQAQVVMHALAVRRPGDGSGLRFGHTAAEIGGHAGLPTSTVSAQLDVLENEGLVEKTAAHGRTQYRIAEQLFRLWLQMRGTRRVRQNVIGLTEFLEAMFDAEELQARRGQEGAVAALAEAKYSFAMAGVCCEKPWRRGLEARGAERVLQHVTEHGGSVDDYLPQGDLPEDLAVVVRMREQLRRCHGGGLSEAEQDALLGSLELRLERKQASVAALCDAATAQEEAARVRQWIEGERQRLLRQGLQAEDLPVLFAKRARGYLPLPRLTPEDAEAAFATSHRPAFRSIVWRLVGAWKWVKFGSEEAAQKWLEWAKDHQVSTSSYEWANVAGAMRRSDRFDAAQRALDQAVSLGECSRAWYERGAWLADTDGDLNDAEIAFRRAMELDVADAWPWNGLGTLLAEKPRRYDEAETAYRKAIELDPTYALPWNNLGALLEGTLKRYDEGEAVYRKAIELDPTFVWPWNNLGAVLTELARYEEAEAAYHHAIELDPLYAVPRNNLGRLQAALGRLDEASTAYVQAAQLEPNPAQYWLELRADLEARRCAVAAKPALAAGDMSKLRSALAGLLELAGDVSFAVVSEHFVEGLLVPTLANSYGKALLDVLRELGYNKHARPLLLAFEAALEHKPERLDDLEPEVQGAARHMYERLTKTKRERKPG